jgi:hypothetical protein
VRNAHREPLRSSAQSRQPSDALRSLFNLICGARAPNSHPNHRLLAFNFFREDTNLSMLRAA